MAVARKSAVAMFAGIALACCSFGAIGCGGSGPTATSTPTPTPTPTPTGPASGSEFLYTFSFGDDIQVATLNTTTGTIGSLTDATTNLSGTLLASAGETFSAVVPGKYFYVAGLDQPAGSGAVFGFAITGAHGELTSIPFSPFEDYDVINAPSGLVVDGLGKYLYLSGGNTILTFQIDQNTGELTDTSEEFQGGTAQLAVVGGDPAGNYIYALESGGDSADIHILAIKPPGGALAEVAGSPFQVYLAPSGFQVNAQLLVSPTGSYLYLSADSFQTTPPVESLYSFSVDSATGALSAVSGSPVAVSNPIDGQLAISPDGKFLYVPEKSGQVQSMSVYAVDPSHGTVSSAPVSSATGTFGNANLIDPSGNVLISAGYEGLFSYTAAWSYVMNGTTGTLSPVTGSPFNDPDPQSGYLYGGSAIVKIP